MQHRTNGGKSGSEDGPSAATRRRITRTRQQARRPGRQLSATRADEGGARSASIVLPTARHEQAELLDGGRLRVALARDRALIHHGDAVGQGENLIEVFAEE